MQNQRQELPSSLLAQGLHVLRRRVIPNLGIQSSLAVDPAFTSTFPLEELRDRALHMTGVDLGFEAGPETFSSMVVARTLGRRGLDAALCRDLCATFEPRHWRRRFRFFHEETVFAADTDCTSVALAALHHARAIGRRELFEGAAQLLAASARADEPGDLRPDVTLVYWEDDLEPGVIRRGRKQDPVVAANATYALLLAREAGFTHPRLTRTLSANLTYIRDALNDGVSRTRYYPSRDAVLFFIGELQDRFPAARLALGLAFRRAILGRLEDRAERPHARRVTVLDLAMRLAAARTSGEACEELARSVVRLRRASGAWAAGPFFTLGRLKGLYFGSDAVTTAVALGALTVGLAEREVAA